MDNKEKKRGFAGLSDLASEVRGGDDNVSSDLKSGARLPSRAQSASPTPKGPHENEPGRKPPASPLPGETIETVSSGKSSGGSGWKWILGIVGVIFVILIANNERHDTKNLLPNTPSPTPNTNELRVKPNKVQPPPRVSPKPKTRENRDMTDEFLEFESPPEPSQVPNIYEDRHSRSTLAQEIEYGKLRAKQMEEQIREMDDRLGGYERRLKYYRAYDMTNDYNLLVVSFNSLVNERNDLYEEYSSLIDEVNTKVRRYNSTYR